MPEMTLRRPKTGGRKAGTPNKATAAKRQPAIAMASDFPTYRVQRVDTLIAYVNNARTHSPEQVAQIVASIREFGFTNPVLTDGKRGIIAGHGRLMAAKALGLETVPTIELAHLTAAQRRAYVLADNKLALAGGWDEELLQLELGELRDEGFDLSLTGFGGLELESILGPSESGSGGDAATAEGDALDGKVCCPGCGYEFQTVAIAAKPRRAT